MSIFDIFIAYVSWGDGGKTRPVLILDKKEDGVTVFDITTKYENKSESVRSKYFKINDWKQAGLDKQSYVDTNVVVALPRSSVDYPVGKLSDEDALRLIDFLAE